MVTTDIARAGAEAAKKMLGVARATKDAALGLIADRLIENAPAIYKANSADLYAARSSGLAGPALSRLAYDKKKLEESLSMLKALSALPDPVGRVLEARLLDDGLTLHRVSCPIGLIALIFESRPDALVQMAALAAKSGNAIIVKGGREAEHSNRVLAGIVAQAGVEAGLPHGWLGHIETRDEVAQLLTLDEYIDLVIPRGSKEFVRHIMDSSRIPVLGHSDGVCHVYIHRDADQDMAVRIAVDSKTQYPAACNAAEILLVDSACANEILPTLIASLEEAGVALELCPKAWAIAGSSSSPRTLKDDDDWSKEYLELRMAVRVVDGLDTAIGHINRFGSGHTDVIVTSSTQAAARFMDQVDSASVYHNTSTRFADGYRYGLGAEVGIATGKIHARGPMGLEGLMTYKWKLSGHGQIVAEYASGEKSFRHIDLDPGLDMEQGSSRGDQA
ncbi:MAG: glutamate-5-semialdehyde dehydrogenase [Spirochaetia bacterium]|jgi:glutamate-5-semialdehyde dehydrogenase|nr:glutamate-5-semialdehyde dehydrogenase [Spirochaetia bacterium]